jgi:hypothetical protein
MIKLHINLITNNHREQKVKEILLKLLNKYDLNKYIITKTINIQSRVIPHSHPILTLNTISFDEHYVLSVFIHEQMHWYYNNRKDEFKNILSKLKKEYKNIPCELPLGARNKKSTYLHIIINFLEYKALISILGKKESKKILLSKPYYTWVYKIIVKDYTKLSKLINI